MDPLFMYKLKAGLIGKPNTYDGMLSEDQAAQAQNQGMMNFGAALLQAGGPSATPVSLGQALGGAVMAGNQAHQSAGQQSIQSLLLKKQLQAQSANRNHVIGNALVDDSGKVIYQGTPLDNVFGRVNPGDYTPASLSKFNESKDWKDLERVWAPVAPIVRETARGYEVIAPNRDGSPAKRELLTTNQQEASALAEKERQKEIGGGAGKLTSELATQKVKGATAFSVYENARNGVANALSETYTGPMVGAGPAFTAARQKADAALAAMAPSLKGIFREAGEGTFTEGDQKLLMDMLPSRRTSPEARDFALSNIDAIVRAKLKVGSFDDYYNSLPRGATFTGPDGKKRVKP